MPQNDTGRSDDVKWDEEYTLIVSDWYNDEHPVLLDQFMNWKNPTGAEPVPSTCYVFPSALYPYPPLFEIMTASILRQADRCADSAAIYIAKNGSYFPSAEAINDGSAVNNNATIPFEAGKKYKIRIINMSALASESHLTSSYLRLASPQLLCLASTVRHITVPYMSSEEPNR